MRESNPGVRTEPRKKHRSLHLGHLDSYAIEDTREENLYVMVIQKNENIFFQFSFYGGKRDNVR